MSESMVVEIKCGLHGDDCLELEYNIDYISNVDYPIGVAVEVRGSYRGVFLSVESAKKARDALTTMIELAESGGEG